MASRDWKIIAIISGGDCRYSTVLIVLYQCFIHKNKKTQKQKQYLYKTLYAKYINSVKLNFLLVAKLPKKIKSRPAIKFTLAHTRAQRTRKEPQIKTPAHKNRKESTTIAQS